MRNGKRILSVKLFWKYDDSPDISWLGEYSDTASSGFSIDRAHAEDCASQTYNPQTKEAQRILEHARETVADWQNALPEAEGAEWEDLEDTYSLLGEQLETVAECDCGRGYLDSRECRYFNPSFNYVDKAGNPLPAETPETVRKYTRQDYERMESAVRGDWCMLGCVAEAEIAVPSGRSLATVQRITSGGLWGIESDCAQGDKEETETEQLADLKAQLRELGFSTRALSGAFKNVERVED